MMGWLLKLVAGNPLTLLWIAAGIAVVAGGAGFSAAWVIQGYRLEAANLRTAEVQGQYDRFADGVKAAGVLAEAEAKAKAAADKKEKEKADAENSRTTATLHAELKRLRDSRKNSGGGIVPPAAPGAVDPAFITFDRAKLTEAIRRLDEGILDLAATGSQAVVDLDTAKGWAKGIDRPLPRAGITFSRESVAAWTPSP